MLKSQLELQIQPLVRAYSSKNFVTSLTANASPITPQTIEVSDASSIEVGDYIIGTGIPSETKVFQ